MPSSLTASPVVPSCVLPAQDLARLRISAAAATTSPSSLASSTSIDAHRRALKQCSDTRIAGWADTVEAKWEKKLRAKTERQEAREKERERVDAEEAELERVETEATLARAKALMFEQSDSFKAFRSAQRYADILETLDLQLNEKDARALQAKAEQARDRDALLGRLAEEDSNEQVAQQRRHKEATAVARMREDTMVEAKHSKHFAALAKQEEGKRLLAQAEREMAEDQAKRQAQKQRCLEDNAAMTQANQHLQELRMAHALLETGEAIKLAAVVQQQEATAAGRVAAAKERFEAKQAVRQRIIDEACAELARKTNNEDARLEKYAQEERKKDEDAATARIQAQRRQRAALLEDMQQHKLQKEASKQAQRQATQRQLEAWAEENAIAARHQQAQDEKKRQLNLEIQTHLDQQRQEIQAARRALLHAPQQLTHPQEEEAERYFQAYVHDEVAKSRALGKPIFPLLQVLKARQPALLPATPNPQARRGPNARVGTTGAAMPATSTGTGAAIESKTVQKSKPTRIIANKSATKK